MAHHWNRRKSPKPAPAPVSEPMHASLDEFLVWMQMQNFVSVS